MSHARFAEIALDGAIGKTLDYEIPLGLLEQVMIGSRVKIPLRGRLTFGVVVKTKQESIYNQVKPIDSLCNSGHLSEPLMQLSLWMSQFYVTPLDQVLRMLIPTAIKKEVQKRVVVWIRPSPTFQDLFLPENEILTEKPKKKLQKLFIKFPEGITKTKLLKTTSLTEEELGMLLEKKFLLPIESVAVDACVLSTPKTLTEEQEKAAIEVNKALEKREFTPFLLWGVTGSGKTEVYFKAIEKALSLNLSVLFLVPEIALAQQTIDRLKMRFKEEVAVMHHKLSEGERAEAYNKMASGEIRIALGPRSVLFAPLQNLGLILIDEEHEGSYKAQEERCAYHAKEVALVRGKIQNCTVVLGSATPSFESYQNALKGKFRLIKLTERPKGLPMPKITTVKMELEWEKAKHKTLFSDRLLSAVKRTVANGEQALLFLNRRGFYSLRMCKECSTAAGCPHCSTSLTYHKESNRLLCHLCAYEECPPSTKCKNCGCTEALQYKGAGTEWVEKKLKAIFPEVRTLRMDADTTRLKHGHDTLIRQFRSGKADVLIGTQMIAKGLDFPNVTLVGILDLDGSLQIPEYRSSEQVFQLITQVAGRAGRALENGEVILQTNLCDQPAIRHGSKQDFLGFFQEEMEQRSLFEYPPFCQITRFILSGLIQEQVINGAETIRSLLSEKLPPTSTIFPINPCGKEKIKDRFRYHFLVKSNPPLTLGNYCDTLPKIKGVDLKIDVNPVQTYF